MKKNIYFSMLVLLVGLAFGSCKSDNSSDDQTNTGTAYIETVQTTAPEWQIDWSNNQDRPTWTEPNASLYENWTILKVQIEDALKPYVSSGDLMALFVNGELRGLASPAVTMNGNQTVTGKFLMKAYGNETGSETVSMTLQYYCSTLQHLFTLTDDINLNSDVTTGIDEAFIPEFTFGSAKYPLVQPLAVELVLKKAGLTPAAGDMVGAFVGDECRGTVSLSASGSTQLLIYGRTAGESLTLKYYDTTAGKLYTIPGVVKL